MASQDRRGLPLSTASDLAATRYREGVDLILSAWTGAAEALDSAIAADPDFALAHAARARLHALRAEPEPARARIAVASELVARRGDERERSHVAVLSFAINGQSPKALEAALAHLDRWPRDALIFSLPLGAFGLFAFSGMAGHDQARVDLCDRHAAQYDSDDWWFLNYRGWAHTENGAVPFGRDLTQRALDIRPANANAAHALAHAMFESGAGHEAEALIADWLPCYDRAGSLHGHIAWHAALSALERGEPGHALALFEQYVQPSVSKGLAINVMTDTASLLWRMRAYGHEVPTRHWDTIAAFAAPVFPKAGIPFVDVHMVFAAAAVGDREAIARRIESLTALLDAGTLSAGPVAPAMCRAVLAFADEDYAGCVRLLEPLAAEIVRIGGSGAQREVVEDTLLVALMRSGETAKARAVLDRRLHRRHSTRDAQWRGLLPD